MCLAVHFANAKKIYMNSYKYRKSITGAVAPTDPEDIHMKLKNLLIEEFLYRLTK